MENITSKDIEYIYEESFKALRECSEIEVKNKGQWNKRDLERVMSLYGTLRAYTSKFEEYVVINKELDSLYSNLSCKKRLEMYKVFTESLFRNKF